MPRPGLQLLRKRVKYKCELAWLEGTHGMHHRSPAARKRSRPLTELWCGSLSMNAWMRLQLTPAHAKLTRSELNARRPV